MKRICLALVAFLLIQTANIYAGGFGAGKNCAAASKSSSHDVQAKTTLADPGEGDYDIKYLKFNLQVTDTSLFIAGDVSTTAQVTATSMINYVFELNGLMTIDSAKVNGSVLPVTTSGFIRRIALPTALHAGSFFTAQIFYHGSGPAGSGFFNGVTHSISSGGTHMVYTVSDPWVAMTWWPAKQSADDKIDSVDMFVTVPRGAMDGSNGVLVNVDTSTTPGFSTCHWQTHYAIDYYLISIAVSRYAEYKSYMHFTGSTDSMLIQNFFLDTATFNPSYKANFDSLHMVINYFSSLFGRYPFWKEKYGVCYTDLPGGMEHQTMTTIGVPLTYIIAHELTHQWFGDHVTYRTWGDMWLSEGFASFSEQLFFTHFWSPAAGRSHRQVQLSHALSNSCGMVYVNDTASSDSLFDQSTVYDKAALVINTLRYLAPSDTLFFNILQTYQSVYGFGLASTSDLKGIAETFYGFSLDTFFKQWIYGRGYPQYNISWNQIGSTVYVKLIQSASCPSYTPHFNTPLELQLHSASADTILKVYNNLDTQIFTFNWAPTMATVYLNPDAITICKLLGAVNHDAALGIQHVSPHGFKILPNPSKNFWQIDEVAENTALTLTDMSGRILWQGKSGSGITVIPGERLPSGNYLLTLNGSGNTESVKLVHW